METIIPRVHRLHKTLQILKNRVYDYSKNRYISNFQKSLLLKNSHTFPKRCMPAKKILSWLIITYTHAPEILSSPAVFMRI